MAGQVLTFPNDRTPLDLLLYLAFSREVPGLVEQTLTQNPGLAALGPFPPRGTKINVTVPPPVTNTVPTPLIRLYS